MINPSELVWLARYKDGSTHTQYNADGDYQDRYSDIVRKELFSFELWSVEQENNQFLPKKLIHRIYFDTPDKKLIYRRKVYKEPGAKEFYIYLAGWQINVGGRNIQSISLIFPDGHVEVIGKWSKDHAFFDQPIIHPHENEDWEFDEKEANEHQIKTVKEYLKKN